MLRCVRSEAICAPRLQILEWMFDSGVCSQMKQGSLAFVSTEALCSLKDLLLRFAVPIESAGAEAQHFCSGSGGADVDSQSIQSQSGRTVLSTGGAAGCAPGSASADGAAAGPDDERTSRG
jgi:hypothetical protein